MALSAFIRANTVSPKSIMVRSKRLPECAASVIDSGSEHGIGVRILVGAVTDANTQINLESSRLKSDFVINLWQSPYLHQNLGALAGSKD